MPKPKHINPRTRWAIRDWTKEGSSANTIQKKLSAQHLGIRRKVLLAEIRRVKHQRVKTHRLKYTPKKYQKMISEIPHPPIIRLIGGSQVVVYQYARTKRNPRAYSARFEFYGRGKDLFRAVKLILDRRLVPRKEWAFVKVNARDFLNRPEIYGEEGVWTEKPEIIS